MKSDGMFNTVVGAIMIAAIPIMIALWAAGGFATKTEREVCYKTQDLDIPREGYVAGGIVSSVFVLGLYVGVPVAAHAHRMIRLRGKR